MQRQLFQNRLRQRRLLKPLTYSSWKKKLLNAKLDPAKFKLLSERYEKENRNVKLVEEFVESYQEAPITGKFYARHEAITIPEHIPDEYVGLVEKIDEEINYKHSSIPPRPSTVNHECEKTHLVHFKIFLTERLSNLFKSSFFSILTGMDGLLNRSYQDRPIQDSIFP